MNAILSVNKTITIAPIKAMLALDVISSKINKIFKKKNSFKGKIGIFDIKNNKINHRLNFYKIEDQKLIEIF